MLKRKGLLFGVGMLIKSVKSIFYSRLLIHTDRSEIALIHASFKLGAGSINML